VPSAWVLFLRNNLPNPPCPFPSNRLSGADQINQRARAAQTRSTALPAVGACLDRPETAPAVAAEAGVPVPVAVFRVGHTTRLPPPSNRRNLDDVLR
jgi:hypothetical protein